MARYDSIRKIERNNALCEYVINHPTLSMREIGLVFNISTSRVSKILKKSKSKCGSTELIQAHHEIRGDDKREV